MIRVALSHLLAILDEPVGLNALDFAVFKTGARHWATRVAAALVTVDIAVTGKASMRSPSVDRLAMLDRLQTEEPYEVYLSDSGYSRLFLHPIQEARNQQRRAWVHTAPELMSAGARVRWDAEKLPYTLDGRNVQ